MAKKRETVNLYGGKADRFRELKADLKDELGYEPTKPEVFAHLLYHYEGDLLDDGRR